MSLPVAWMIVSLALAGGDNGAPCSCPETAASDPDRLDRDELENEARPLPWRDRTVTAANGLMDPYAPEVYGPPAPRQPANGLMDPFEEPAPAP